MQLSGTTIGGTLSYVSVTAAVSAHSVQFSFACIYLFQTNRCYCWKHYTQFLFLGMVYETTGVQQLQQMQKLSLGGIMFIKGLYFCGSTQLIKQIFI